MECEKYKEEKVLLLYGESGPDARALQEHLEACPSCREELEELDEALLAYREAAEETMPAALRGRVLRRQAPRAMWFSNIAAAVAVALLLGLLIRPPGPEPEPISWREVDFEGIRLVLEVTPKEREEARRCALFPAAWDDESFAGGRLDEVRSRLLALSETDFW
jgi:hypothetical protein